MTGGSWVKDIFLVNLCIIGGQLMNHNLPNWLVSDMRCPPLVDFHPHLVCYWVLNSNPWS